MKLPIIKMRSVWFMISGTLVALSIVALVAFPLKLGLDFTGGSMLEVDFQAERPQQAQVVDSLAGLNLGELVTQTSGDKGMLIRLKETDEETHQKMLAALKDKFGGVEERSFVTIGPTVGAELKSKALMSITLVLIAIALYIAYAFRKVSRPVASWKYAVTTLVVGLGHDVLIPVAAVGVACHVAGAEVNSNLIAALLTVLSFTVHDTIVVFDRIRENLLKTSGSFEEILERSVNETLARSINTSLSTVLPLIAIWFLGGASLKWFAFTLIIGIISGTYSSIFLCSPLLMVMQGQKGKGRR